VGGDKERVKSGRSRRPWDGEVAEVQWTKRLQVDRPEGGVRRPPTGSVVCQGSESGIAGESDPVGVLIGDTTNKP
jgi:hypothetical protein